IQGLADHAGQVYVMHAPLLTRLSDTDGDGVADERRDLIAGIGMPPEENDNRLHSANGVVYGHDGWLYLALGDRGCDVRRPEGDRLLFQEGGILRCRTDGSDLHVFSRGLRNIYDVALDAELNVFVRDNENDGGDYMIRVCHCFHGSDHGYPYLYRERPEEAMRPLADLGRGSSAGGTAYLEAAFSQEYRQSLFFCEWGRAVVRYRLCESGSGFADVQEAEFAAGAPNDPYGFKPTDLVVDRDGSLLISDWADGQRPKRGRGRIYRVTSEGHENRQIANDIPVNTPLPDLRQALDSDSCFVRIAAQEAIEQHGAAGFESAMAAISLGPRGRSHAVWALAHTGGMQAIKALFNIAAVDPDVRVRVQAVRAIADLTDPVLVSKRLEAGRGDADVGRGLAALAEGADPPVQREILIALGRLRWADAPQWLRENWNGGDAAVSHAAMVLLRRADNWPGVLALLDHAETQVDSEPPVRTVALRALANRADPIIVDGLCARLEQEQNPEHRRAYLDLLARVHKKPAEWTYWGFRPAPRPANSVDWDRTEHIGAVLANALTDPDADVRAFAGRRMLREEIDIPLPSLTVWLAQETQAEAVSVILEALTKHPAEEVRGLLEGVIQSGAQTEENRLSALTQWAAHLQEGSESRLLDTGKTLDEGPVLAAMLREIGRRPKVDGSQLFMDHLEARQPDVRVAAMEGLLERPASAMVSRIPALLDDADVRVRRAAALLAGTLKVQASADRLLELANDADRPLRSASLRSLGELQDPRAVFSAVDALNHPECQAAALTYLAQQGDVRQRDAVFTAAASSREVGVLAAAVNALITWQGKVEPQSDDWNAIERTIAGIQAASGVPLQWRIAGPMAPEAATELIDRAIAANPSDIAWIGSTQWAQRSVDPADGSVQFVAERSEGGTSHWLAATDLHAAAPSQVEFLAAADGNLTVWLNGVVAYRRQETTAFAPNSDRFQAALSVGNNRLLVDVSPSSPDARMQITLRRKSSKAEHEQLVQQALQAGGNSERGRELFLNAEKSLCLKCHRYGDGGGRIGPDLTGIGRRFSRIHLIEAILEPSRTVAPSYENQTVVLGDGRVLSGVKVAETGELLTLGDEKGLLHEIPKADIEEMRSQSRSTMPEGLEKQMTEREFVDLIAYLASPAEAPSQ
ncbi:MAG: HEAT repeat domain-containing protein, partial [Planctomycetaceae bacterium]